MYQGEDGQKAYFESLTKSEQKHILNLVNEIKGEVNMVNQRRFLQQYIPY